MERRLEEERAGREEERQLSRLETHNYQHHLQHDENTLLAFEILIGNQTFAKPSAYLLFWYTTTLSRPVKSIPQSAYSRQNSQIWPKQAKISHYLC